MIHINGIRKGILDQIYLSYPIVIKLYQILALIWTSSAWKQIVLFYLATNLTQLELSKICSHIIVVVIADVHTRCHHISHYLNFYRHCILEY